MSEFVVITPGAEVDMCEEMNHTSTIAVVYRIGRRLHAKELDQLNIWLQGLIDDKLGPIGFKVRHLEFYDEDTMSSLLVKFKTPASTHMV